MSKTYSSSVAHFNKLPKPIAENYDWQYKGACNGVDTELFYLPHNARGAEKLQQIKEAKAVCAKCPVIEQCLNFAIKTEEPHGIWGGLTEEERVTIVRRTKRLARKMQDA